LDAVYDVCAQPWNVGDVMITPSTGTIVQPAVYRLMYALFMITPARPPFNSSFRHFLPSDRYGFFCPPWLR
jgi:hypothetical protein